MSIEQAKSKIVARIWQSVAASGVSLASLPKEQLETLVNAIADGVLVAVDDALEDAGVAARQTALASTPGQSAEQVLWEGRPFLSLVTFYRITNERVRVVRGLLGRDFEDIELIRIQDLDRSQGLGERLWGFGDIQIRSADPSHPELTLNNVRDPEQVHEILRRAMLDARKRFRYSVQEEM